jgi:tetratricopeptide (TPR) repeat protein
MKQYNTVKGGLQILLMCLFLVLAFAPPKGYSQGDIGRGIPPELRDLMKMGMALEEESKLEEAKVAYEKVFKAAPDFPDVYARLAYTLQKLGYAKDANKMFSKCKEKGIPAQSEYIPELFRGQLLTKSIMISPAPRSEAELLNCKKVFARGLIYSEEGSLMLVIQKTGDGLNLSPEVMVRRPECKLGIGSELSFDKNSWVDFVGGKYRRGGVSITENGIRLWEGTEKLDQGLIFIFIKEKWEGFK